MLQVLWISSKCMFPAITLQQANIKEKKKIYNPQSTTLSCFPLCYVLLGLHI